MEKCSL